MESFAGHLRPALKYRGHRLLSAFDVCIGEPQAAPELTLPSELTALAQGLYLARSKEVGYRISVTQFFFFNRFIVLFT
jgi:hypothetical protein